MSFPYSWNMLHTINRLTPYGCQYSVTAACVCVCVFIYYLHIENAEGYVLIAVYLFVCVRVCVLFA